MNDFDRLGSVNGFAQERGLDPRAPATLGAFTTALTQLHTTATIPASRFSDLLHPAVDESDLVAHDLPDTLPQETDSN